MSHDKKETFAGEIFGKICYVACTINHAGHAIAQVSLRSLHLKAKFNKTIIVLITGAKQVEVLFPIEETMVRSIRTDSKLRPSLLLCLFCKPQSCYIVNQNGSAKETVSLNVGENIEMLVCSICVAI